MISLVERILPWSSSHTNVNAMPDFEKENVSFSPPDSSTRHRHPDRLTFWSRLMCAPEVQDSQSEHLSSPCVVPLCSNSHSLSPSTSFATSALTECPLQQRKSVFAKQTASFAQSETGTHCDDATHCHSPRQPQQQQQQKHHSDDSHLHTSAVHGASRAAWTVTDTRRMNDVNDAQPTTTRGAEDLARRKKDRMEQIKQSARRAREMQRDAEALAAEANRRSAAISSLRSANTNAPSLHSSLESSHAMGEEEEGGNPLPTPNREAWADASCNTSFAASEGPCILEGDDAIDLHDLNRLYEHYKRREGPLHAAHEETQTGGSTTAPKKARPYTMKSRQYTERVVLGHRSQQFLALMFLLSESMRQAWRLNLRLAQLYCDYVPSYLHAALHAGGAMTDAETVAITKESHYQRFSTGGFDYEYFRYQFSSEWEELFSAVRGYLGDGSDAPEGAGSVGVAATVLYSMELFERQRALQLAVRRVEVWIQREWHKLQRSGAPNNAQTHGDTQSKEMLSADASAADAMGIIPTERAEEELLYIPMNWQQAWDEDTRANVSWTRKKRKLRHMYAATQSLRRWHKSTEAEELERHTSSLPQQWTPVLLESISDEEGSEGEAPSHRIVNVGCFGFSFFSRWD